MAVGSFPPCIPRINMTKFFGCSIRTGSLFLGYLSMISSLILAVIVTIYIPLICMNKVNISPLNKRKFIYLISICDVMLALGALISYLMIRGVKKYKPSLMYPWIYSNFVGLILITVASILVTIINIYSMIKAPGDNDFWSHSLSIGQTTVFSAFNYYCFGAVVSYCQKIIQDNSLTQHQRFQNENL